MSAVSRIPLQFDFPACLSESRVERSRERTVIRATVRGSRFPTFTSLRNPASGFAFSFPCRSRPENMDLSVANRRRTVVGFTEFMPLSQRRIKSRSTEAIRGSPDGAFIKARKCDRSCR